MAREYVAGSMQLKHSVSSHCKRILHFDLGENLADWINSFTSFLALGLEIIYLYLQKSETAVSERAPQTEDRTEALEQNLQSAGVMR